MDMHMYVNICKNRGEQKMSLKEEPFNYFLSVFVMLETKSMALCMAGKGSKTKIHLEFSCVFQDLETIKKQKPETP